MFGHSVRSSLFTKTNRSVACHVITTGASTASVSEGDLFGGSKSRSNKTAPDRTLTQPESRLRHRNCGGFASSTSPPQMPMLQTKIRLQHGEFNRFGEFDLQSRSLMPARSSCVQSHKMSLCTGRAVCLLEPSTVSSSLPCCLVCTGAVLFPTNSF